MTTQPEKVKPLHIAFRCDASPEIGSGHVMRCLTLAHYLAKKGNRITFVTEETSLNTVAALRDSRFDIQHSEKNLSVDWLVVDHYGLDKGYEKTARIWADKIFVIDDLADREHDCDILLDQTYGRKKEDYEHLVPSSCEMFCGAEYAILRPAFIDMRQQLSRQNRAGENIFLSFGGVNPRKATQRIIDFLDGYRSKSLNINVIFGGDKKTYNDIYEHSRKLGYHTYNLHQNSHNIAPLMSEADLAIGAGGTMSWERCCMKLPTIGIDLADNQTKLLELLNKRGALINLGKIESLDKDDFLGAFSELVENGNRLKTMSDIAGAICDGRGMEKLYPVFIPAVKLRTGEAVTVRAATMDDCETVFAWQTEEGVREYSRNPKPPEWGEHKTWFENALHDLSRQLYIVYCDKEACGIVRLDKIHSDENMTLEHKKEGYEVSILISSAFHGRGMGFAALTQLSYIGCGQDLWAMINSDNTKSVEVFNKAGYIHQCNGWYKKA